MDLAPACEQLHEQTIPYIAVFAVLRQLWPHSGASDSNQTTATWNIAQYVL